MKKILFVILFIFSSLPVMAEDKLEIIKKYETQIEQCDKQQEKLLESEEAMSTAGTKHVYFTTSDCYNKVVYDIIDIYYSKNAKKLKDSFDTYTKAVFQLEWDMNWLNNRCPGSCGTILDLQYSEKGKNQTKSMVLDFLQSLEYFESW